MDELMEAISTGDIEPMAFVFFGVIAFFIFAFVFVRINNAGANKVRPLASKLRGMVIKYDSQTIVEHMTGQTTATILSREIVRETNRLRRHQKGKYNYFYYAEYEYQVDGQTYRCVGENTGAFWMQKKTPIYYDPQNPAASVTKYVRDKALGKNQALGSLIFVFLFFVALVLLLKLAM